MNEAKRKDMADVLRQLATVKTNEPSTFRMSKKNKDKWLAMQRKAQELRGG